ncbi:hypothetical protein GGR54DRAFT_260103 [Hypoxylon sp. NC1633]|nr:hypothetical protein GGR54DRAFT_260103 [Hypoxylon sp. NC1633]
MSGLIPLLLPSSAGSRPGLNSSHPETGRRASLAPSSSPSQSASLMHRRQQSLPSLGTTRRYALAPPAAISIIPFTPAEWKKAIEEVKRKYLNRKYRACSARCCEILDSLRDRSTVEPIYLIYLHFYAASSFELCARPLSCSSNYRTRLLHDAQSHYLKAEALIQSAETSINHRTRPVSLSSTASSIHSPGLSSPSNRSSVSSTTLSSPRTSVCSAEDGVALKSGTRPVKAKKKVSFSGLNDLIEFQPEPYIRPDSPTLGWDDDIFPRDSHNSLPLFLAEKSKPELLSRPIPAAEPERIPEPQPEVTEQQSTEQLSPADENFNLDSFLQTRTQNRMSAQLSALRLQVSWHRAGVAALLAIPDDTPATPTLPPDGAADLSKMLTPPRSTPANTFPTEVGSGSSPDEKPAPWTAPSLRDSFAGSPCFDNPATTSRPTSSASTIRCSDGPLQQRIERLRASGWQRKRFDSRRYEALREQVLVELGA